MSVAPHRRPVVAPMAVMASTRRLRVFTASMMGVYAPSRSRMNEPLRPGTSIAIAAASPARNNRRSLADRVDGLVSAGRRARAMPDSVNRRSMNNMLCRAARWRA